uniref:EF-hand calcium binding domain 2 n=1 Tax=Rattus norvegicus TaxID=10116 RepID=D3ZXJ2_RAT
MAEEKDPESTEAIVAELHKKIKEAFEVFDHESNNTVDVRFFPATARSLLPASSPFSGALTGASGLSGPCLLPSLLLLSQVEEEEPTGYIRFEKFIPVMTTVLLEKRYRPIAEDVLLRAFEVLDPTKRGFLTKDELVKYMTEEGVLFPWRLPLELELHGEPFSQEEMEEMLSAAIDPESNTINYRDYITMMVIDEN